MKGGGMKEVGEGGRRKEGGAQWAVPSSKDSTPESQVLDASFSCRLLMISCSSEPELLWRPKTGGAEADRHRKLVSVRTSFTPKVSTQRLNWRLVDKMAARRGRQRQGAQVGPGVAQEPGGHAG